MFWRQLGLLPARHCSRLYPGCIPGSGSSPLRHTWPEQGCALRSEGRQAKLSPGGRDWAPVKSRAPRGLSPCTDSPLCWFYELEVLLEVLQQEWCAGGDEPWQLRYLLGAAFKGHLCLFHMSFESFFFFLFPCNLMQFAVRIRSSLPPFLFLPMLLCIYLVIILMPWKKSAAEISNKPRHGRSCPFLQRPSAVYPGWGRLGGVL